jgi:hypothetical protein
MATSFAPFLVQLFDDYGDVLAGGKVYTYEAGTSTPLATYQDRDGLTANANPTVLDAAGRATIRFTEGVAYKVIVKDSADQTISTEDNIIIGEAASASTEQFEIMMTFVGTPGAQQWMGGEVVRRSISFDVDFDGADGAVITNPGADYVISIEKNGVEVGTCTFDTSGTPTFATSGGATVSLISGDSIDFYGPDTVGTAADIKITLVGDL